MVLVRQLAWPLAAAIWLFYALVRYPAIDPATVLYRPALWAAVPLAVILGYALAVQGALAWRNRRRWRRILRPSRGRILGAVALMLVTPFGVVNWLPWIVGPLMLMGLANGNYAALLIGLAITLVWYPLSANLVTGIPARLPRFGAFCLMFWGACCALILGLGVQHFNL